MDDALRVSDRERVANRLGELDGAVWQDPTAAELIPGGYERRPATGRQPGALSGPPYGSADVLPDDQTMDADTIAEHEKEGGGAKTERRR